MKKYKYKEYFSHVIPCLGYGILSGSVTGAIIFLFKLGAKYLEELSRFIYSNALNSPFHTIAIFVSLIGFAFLMAFLHKKLPEVKGGGIPRSEGILRGILTFRWFTTLIGTVFGSFISFFCGLPLGSEGPAVLMGTSAGAMCGAGKGKRSAWNRYVMTGGAGAGFAIATGSPLSAMLFALEEIHKRFTPMLILSVSTSVLSATYVNSLLSRACGLSTELFHIGKIGSFELSHVGYLLLLGLLVAAAVGVFNEAIELFNRFIKRVGKVIPEWAMLVVVFLITGVAGIFFADGIYSGHHLIVEAATVYMPLTYLLLIFVFRFVMMLFTTGSGATGGIFLPTLAVGAVISAVFARLLIAIGMPAELFSATVFLGMCAFIGGTLRAPLTATVLFLEFTGVFTNLFYVAIVVFVVNFVIELLNQKPFYDRVLEGMEKKQNEGKKAKLNNFEMKVSAGSFVVGKAVRDVMWPSSSVVTEIRRADDLDGSRKDLDHDGEKLLLPGDTVIIRIKYFDEESIKKHLHELVGNDAPIKVIS